MTTDRMINVLVLVTLVEMMVATGLGVNLGELVRVVRNWRLIARGALANYVCVPAAAVGLLLLFNAPPIVAAGFLILAVCPGAPFGPPLARVAKGNATAAVGLMVVLAGSSAVLAPVLLYFLLPMMAADETLSVDAVRVVRTLLLTQLLPLGVGVALRRWRPLLADRLQKPGDRISKVLNLSVVGLILIAQFDLLLGIRPLAYLGMLALLLASWAAGWLLGGPEPRTRRTMTLTASLRNVGVGLVIATNSFAGTPAVTAAVVYGLVEIVGSLLLAVAWARREPSARPPAAAEAAALDAPEGQFS
jgi:BASS family bile acid:Na+ symporter